MSTTAAALTPRQQQVYDLIVKGVPVADVAKRLKISRSGVHGHVRNIRAAGFDLPEAASAAPRLVATSGVADPAEAIRQAIAAFVQAIAADRRRSVEIDEQISVLNAESDEQISVLNAESERLQARVAQYEAALAALNPDPAGS
jgi:transposase